MGYDFAARARQRATLFVLVLGASAGLVFAACGLDDSAVKELAGADGSFSDTGTVVDESGKPIGDAGEPDVFVCTPETCNSYPSICRPGLSNNCGGDIDCSNACPSGQACIPDSGTCDGPPVCRDAGSPGGNCGTIVNPGNGLDASCGSCTNNYACAASTCTCSGTVCGTECCNGASPNCSTTANTCCKATTCTTGTCNPTNAQACGGNLDCSANCGGGTQCGTTGYICDTPLTCTNKGALGGSCGTLTTAHGVTTACGTCTTGLTCSAANICTCASGLTCGTSCCASSTNVCNGTTCCAPVAAATTCAGNKCGFVANNCGQTVTCGMDDDGGCETPEVCSGTASCTCHTQTCMPTQACCGPDGAHVCVAGGTCP